MIFKFNNYIEDRDNKLENMYKELNDKYNNLALVFNEVVDKVAWWIPAKKWGINLEVNLSLNYNIVKFKKF